MVRSLAQNSEPKLRNCRSGPRHNRAGRGDEIIVDGEVAHTISVRDGEHQLTVEECPGEGSRWVAVRARGGKARYSGDSYTFAHTTPVYFTDALPNDASRASADFLAAVIEEIWRRVDQRDAWLVPEDREVYRRHLDEALARFKPQTSPGKVNLIPAWS
ncbi:MAG: hypothetical protein Ct9H300mP15_24880 [Gemmatimonadota bacterium]|nr:MAG: hypothetical protein Ct9H300mP15_24880 [Gemmatimonadota bacterium]